MDGKWISCDNDFVIYINIESLSCVPETSYSSKEKKKKKQLKKKEICKNMQKWKKQLKKKEILKKKKKAIKEYAAPHGGKYKQYKQLTELLLFSGLYGT